MIPHVLHLRAGRGNNDRRTRFLKDLVTAYASRAAAMNTPSLPVTTSSSALAQRCQRRPGRHPKARRSAQAPSRTQIGPAHGPSHCVPPIALPQRGDGAWRALFKGARPKNRYFVCALPPSQRTLPCDDHCYCSHSPSCSSLAPGNTPSLFFFSSYGARPGDHIGSCALGIGYGELSCRETFRRGKVTGLQSKPVVTG